MPGKFDNADVARLKQENNSYKQAFSEIYVNNCKFLRTVVVMHKMGMESSIRLGSSFLSSE